MKTIVGLFDNRADATHVVQELVDLGIDRDDISMIASESMTETTRHSATDTTGVRTQTADTANAVTDGALAGAAVGGVGGILLGLTALAIPGIGPVVAAGPLFAGLLGAGVGAAVGGLVGVLTEAGVPEEQAGYFAEGVRRGGTLVSVSANDDDVADIVQIMDRHNPVNVDERASMWQEEGWTGFNEQTHSMPGMSTARSARTDDSSYMPGRQLDRSHSAANLETEEVSIPVMEEDRHATTPRTERDTMHIQTGTDYDESGSRSHYQSTYASSGRAWDDYAPAYRYGYDLNADDRFRGRRWNDIEADVRRDWSRSHSSSNWEDFKEAVRHGWERTKQAVRA